MKTRPKALYGYNLFGDPVKPSAGIVAEKFIVPPFSILDGTSAFWVKRRRMWDSMGFNSILGRPINMLKFSPASLDACGGKLPGEFDPVLCELAYRWFCPAKGLILDPFSGGSVRGIVAAFCGYHYVGMDLREEQVAENRKQAAQLSLTPSWITGDSRTFAKRVNTEGDFIFSSPPYFNREHHCDLPEDLNNSDTYEQFLVAYRTIIQQVSSRLRNNRFACFEVAETRDKDGRAISLVSDTIDAFRRAGLDFYNHAIHKKSIGSASIRTNMFGASRKLVPVHEHVLVFVKGDPKVATKLIGNEGLPKYILGEE